MSRKKPLRVRDSQARIALCYIRLSYTRDEDDSNSPERQRDNIRLVCERKGWIPEWYEDVGGHRSGTSIEKRPGWLALKERISDPDVVAIVANDLSRLHRNISRISTLIEQLEQHGVALVLAASDVDIDTSTLMGQMFAQFSGLMDAYYAKDIAAKTKDSIAYRKRRGMTVGLPPFGTIRNEQGYLQPSSEGAWLLPGGRFVSGTPDQEPEEGAIWRGYYECAHRILVSYVENDLVLYRISYEMNHAGWAFRDRWGEPRPIERDDVRRVIANFFEYGGVIIGERSKDRPAYEDYDPDEIAFNEERAVFPISLLRAVARVRQERTIRPANNGVNRVTHPYALANITFCAHCEGLAQKHDNPKLRSRLGGSESYGKLRYRHKGGVKCGCRNRSVPCHEFEQDFARLIRLLTIKPEAINLMVELAIQVDKTNGTKDTSDPEQEKQEAIALCRRRIEAATDLYMNGRMSKEDYWQRVEENEREIAHWETRTTETEKLAMELAMCMDIVNTLSRMWDISDAEERQSMARSLFSELIYDLDTRRIVRFKLKPWADRFLTLRSSLYDIEDGEQDGSDADDNVNQAADAEIMADDGEHGTEWQAGSSKLLGGNRVGTRLRFNYSLYRLIHPFLAQKMVLVFTNNRIVVASCPAKYRSIFNALRLFWGLGPVTLLIPV